jgi:type II restriction enzyme
LEVTCNPSIAASYKSPSQIARVLSERWLLANMYCVNCESAHLQATPANTRCLDFTCDWCRHRYELKTFLRRPATSLVDGAYDSMLATMNSGMTPTLFLLQRDAAWKIENFSAIHSAFLTLRIIEKRKPLAQNARRAGWTGCNIRLDRLPIEAEIPIISNGKPEPEVKVRTGFRRLLPLSKLSLADRDWTSLTLSVVRQFAGEVFSLQDLYRCELAFAEAYPGNHNIRPKIRQQLQRLRDLGLLRFLGRGSYQSLR